MYVPTNGTKGGNTKHKTYLPPMQSLFIKRHVDYNGYYACYYWQS